MKLKIAIEDPDPRWIRYDPF